MTIFAQWKKSKSHPATAPPRIITCKDNKMISINLPHSDIKIGGTREKPMVLDILRHRYVALTPEEWVRQNFVHYLISELHYPSGLLANEVSMVVGTKRLRADSVLYDRNMHPRMIIEYKAPSVKITPKVLEQVATYNLLLHVDYLVMSNGLTHYCCKMDYESKKYVFLSEIPAYENL